MSVSRFIGAAVAVFIGTVQPGFAQSGPALPAEIPPASYDGNQYVDSAGCVFIRAGLAGSVNWVPRLTRDRQPLCGFEPSLGGRVASPLPSDVPVITVDQPATTVTSTYAPASAPQVSAPVATSAPMRTVASVTSAPTIGAVATPTVAPVPQVTEPEPLRITLSELCAGRSGVLSGYINANTGQPVDCGPALVAAPATTTIYAPVGGRSCETIGQAYLTGGTGREVRCGPQTQPIGNYGSRVPASNPIMVPTTRTAPSAPAVSLPTIAPVAVPTPVTPTAPVVAPSNCALDSVSAQYMRGGDVRCSPQSQSPSGRQGAALDGQSTSVQVARASSSGFGAGLFGPVVPASNPAYALVGTRTAPDGYISAWDDGRLNPQRGIPGTVVR